MSRRMLVQKAFFRQHQYQGQHQHQPQRRSKIYQPWRAVSLTAAPASPQAASRPMLPPKHYQKLTTDEGVVVFQADAESMVSDSGQGLVWGSRLWPSGISLSKYLAANWAHGAGAALGMESPRNTPTNGPCGP